MTLNRILSATFCLMLLACQQNTKPPVKEATTKAPTIKDISKSFRIEILKPEGEKIISSSAKIDIIAEGQNWTEGPLYVPDGDYFLYSDIPENKIFKWKEGEGKSLFLTPSGTTGYIPRKQPRGSNGLVLNAQGQLVLMQHGDRRVALCTTPLSAVKPVYKTLADKYQGKRLNSPNDGDFHSNGDLYFTDPPYGLDELHDDAEKELDFQGVYCLRPNGQLDLVTKVLKNPNGIGLSHDEKQLYVANSEDGNLIWWQIELDENGLAKSEKLFYNASAEEDKYEGAPDGLVVNSKEIIFATGPGGVWIFNKDAAVLARIYTGQKTSNCDLSSDEKTLFMTADDYVLKVDLL